MTDYDIIIIGAGPGGLTAGIYAGRQGTKNLIIDRDLAGGLGREVPEMENYPGFDKISGLELIEKMKAQAIKNCDLHEMEDVLEITKTDGEYRFIVKTNKDEYQAKSIILATGSSHRHLNTEGEEAFKGKGVSYCATCDGFFFAGRDIIMVGGGNSALQEALYLKNLGANVTLVHRRDEFFKGIKQIKIDILFINRHFLRNHKGSERSGREGRNLIIELHQRRRRNVLL